MNLPNRNKIEVVAIFFGSILLVGPLTYVILVATTDIIGRLLWVDTGFSEILKLGTNAGVFLFTLIFVIEVTRIQLFGFTTLQQGSIYRQLGKHTVLISVCLSSIVVMSYISYSIILAGLRGGSLVISCIGFAIILSLIYALVRSGVALYRTIIYKNYK